MMRRTLTCIAISGLLAFGPPAPALRAQSPPTLADALDAIAAYAPRAMREQKTPGLSVAITDRSKTLRVIALGYANIERQTPVTAQTRFAIGSITKSMTALALMQLYDERRLNLDAPVSRYLPWFAIRAPGPILVHELLSHTAGLPDDFASEEGYRYNVVALRNARTIFAPGSAWAYSNDGYETAGSMLSALDGRFWTASLQARVFDPIGMTASSPAFTPETMQAAATGYQFVDNDRPPPPHPALTASPLMDFIDPAGSVLSTPEDMAGYIRFYLNGGKTESGTRLISPAAFALMTNPDRLRDGKAAGSPTPELAEAPAFYRRYGFGLSIFDDRGDHLIGHTGGVSGYTACMQANLTRGYGVIAFANLVEAPLHPCAIVLYAMRVLRAQALGQPLPAPPAPPPDPARVDRPAGYAGTYTAPDGSNVRVIAGDHRLTLLDGDARSTLYPNGSDQFWSDDPRRALFVFAFGRNRTNGVVDVTYGSKWYASTRYAGPRHFPYPAKWDALSGRYENTYGGQPQITRVLVVKGHLTLDGTTVLQPLNDGTFAVGTSVVRFADYAGSRPQRLSIDASDLYRVELP